MKKQPHLHNALPKWMLKVIDTKLCFNCKAKIAKADIVSIGIRAIDEKNTLFMEHMCSKCKSREITSMGGHKVGSVEDMCYTLIEELQKKKTMDLAKKTEQCKNETPMTAKEVKDFLSFMQKSESYNDFLKHIGAENQLPTDND